MVLLCWLFTLITLGSSLSLSENLCYGDIYSMPIHFTSVFYNKTITYTPKVGDPKIVVNHGRSLDSRVKVSRGRISMENISERDNDATLSIVDHVFDSVILRVKNCRSIVKKFCGSFIYWVIPHGAEYLEFSGPDVFAPPTILWNRTNGLAIRGKASGGDYEIKNITQRDSGYYRFRGSRDELLKWEQILVEEHVQDYDFDEGGIKLEYPIIFTPNQVMFTPTGTYKAKTVSEDDGRFKITSRYLAIEYATPEDAGTYDFLDKDGNLILRVRLEIREVEKVWVSVVVLAAISFGFILCCCCMKKCCCKESSNKTNSPESETEAAAPSVYHNGTQTAEPVTPLLSRDSRVVFPDPPRYNEIEGHTDPPPPYEECDTHPPAPSAPTCSCPPENPPVPGPQANSPESDVANDTVMTDVCSPDQVSEAEVAEVAGAAGAAETTTFPENSFNLTDDSNPHFELRSSTVASTLPLSSDGSNSAEYNSDKLNFI